MRFLDLFACLLPDSWAGHERVPALAASLGLQGPQPCMHGHREAAPLHDMLPFLITAVLYMQIGIQLLPYVYICPAHFARQLQCLHFVNMTVVR